MTVNFTCNEDRSNCSFPAVSCTKEEVTLGMPCNTEVGFGDSIALIHSYIVFHSSGSFLRTRIDF